MAKRDSLPWRSYWITGASSGIGAALARLIAAPGRRLYLSGRSAERLTEVAEDCRAAGAVAETIAFDMADGNERDRIVRMIRRGELSPDVLINNAGVSQRGYAAQTATSVDRMLMEVNYLAAVEFTKAVLPAMLAGGRGCIVAVSSVAGLVPVPLRSGYNAAKASQLAFFGTLANELADSGVCVSLVIPGFVRTAVSLNALTEDGSASAAMDPNQANGISPERAARDIVRGLERRRTRIATGMTARLRVMLFLSRFAPAMLDRILRNVSVR